MNSNTPLVIAHRGFSAKMPENTLAAFDLAFTEGKSDMIEFDLWLSRDYVPVIIHDKNLLRTTGFDKLIPELTFAEIQKIPIIIPSSRESAALENLSYVPSLEEVLKRYSQPLMLEIKDPTKRIVDECMSLIKQHNAESRCVIGSMKHIISKQLESSYPQQKRLCSNHEIFLLYLEYRLKTTFFASKCPLVASMPTKRRYANFMDPKWVNFLLKKSIEVYFWTIDNENEMRDLIEMSVTGIITNDPARLWRVRNGQGGIAPEGA